MASEDALNAIIDAVATQLEGVTGIGHVHRYVRWAASESAFQTLMFTGSVIHAWQVTRVSSQERGLTGREVWRAHVLAIQGFYGLLDENATEITFQNLVERVCAKFRHLSSHSLGGAESIGAFMGDLSSISPTQGAISGVQVLSIDHRMVQGKLCHFADLRLGVQEAPQYMVD